jgi:hypothetical protein
MTSFDGYDDPEEFRGIAGRHARRDIETDLRDLIELIANAKQMPLSNSALVPRDDVLGLFEQALHSLPDEIREARWALRDREELMAAEVQKAQQLMDQVRAEAARMVDKTEIVRQSRLKAEQIVADAHAQARQMINESEDFMDGQTRQLRDRDGAPLKDHSHSGRERLNAQSLPNPSLIPSRNAKSSGPAAPAATGALRRGHQCRRHQRHSSIRTPTKPCPRPTSSPWPSCCATCPHRTEVTFDAPFDEPHEFAPARVTPRPTSLARRPSGAPSLESFSGGLRAGTVEAPWHGICRRCSTPVLGMSNVAVNERFVE